MENKDVILDEIVIDLVCILELTNLFIVGNEANKFFVKKLEEYIQDFYTKVKLLDISLIDDLLFYISSLVNAHNNDIVLSSLAMYFYNYINELNKNRKLNVK